MSVNTRATATNLTRRSEPEQAVVVDVSSTGMRIETSLKAEAGDALRIEVPGLTVLSEVTRFEGGPVLNVLGMKLLHSLNHDELAAWLEPSVWEELCPALAR